MSLRRIQPFFLFVLLLAVGSRVQSAERPNFVWLLSEDNSKHYLQLFDENGTETPNIAKMAQHGLAFQRAFSCAPVCSVARTTLITSCYAPRIGTQFHRKYKIVALPEGWRMFPAYLREAGYYTTNNAKKDYNAIESPGVWDESSRKATWRKRPGDDTPFFHMQTFTGSHESSLHFNEQFRRSHKTTTKPSDVVVPPQYPDTPLFRYTIAHYHDRIAAADAFVGGVLKQLEDDELLEDTFVFYFGDHGGVLPGSKGYIEERGVHVPLVVRVPEKWKRLVRRDLGSNVNGFVEFIDFGPTLLALAGLDVPAHMDGKPFLGSQVSPEEVDARNEAFSYADRFDEKYDLRRAIRVGEFKYIRNFQSHYPDGLQNNYRYRMLAYRQWRDMSRNEKLTEVQNQFFSPKPAEALYDLREDPYETRNLADDPGHSARLHAMRARLMERMTSLPDLSLFPECELVETGFESPVAFGRSQRKRIAKLLETANLALLPFGQAIPQLEASLSSDDPWQRYWAVVACTRFGADAKSLLPLIEKRLNDEEPLVRVQAAEFLGRTGLGDPRPTIMDVLASSESHVEAVLTLNSVVYLQDVCGVEFEIKPQSIRAAGDGVKRRLEYLVKKSSR